MGAQIITNTIGGFLLQLCISFILAPNPFLIIETPILTPYVKSLGLRFARVFGFKACRVSGARGLVGIEFSVRGVPVQHPWLSANCCHS